MEFKANKNPIGNFHVEKPFNNIEIQLNINDKIYLFSDGYADQFGGLADKKFKRNRFKELIISASKRPITKQKNIFEETFIKWKGDKEQTDDVLVFCIQV